MVLIIIIIDRMNCQYHSHSLQFILGAAANNCSVLSINVGICGCKSENLPCVIIIYSDNVIHHNYVIHDSTTLYRWHIILIARHVHE